MYKVNKLFTMPTPSLDLQRLERYDENTTEYPLAIITDEDKASQITLEDGQTAWRSTIRYDRLIRSEAGGQVRYRVEEPRESSEGVAQLISIIAEGSRGAEFSELALMDRHLLTFDDRTGLVCELRHGQQLVPRQIMMTGSGDEAFKGFKCEWATLKDDIMYVGSHGRPKTEGGKAVTGPLEWVKLLDADYRLRSLNWHAYYTALRDAVGIDSAQGYLTHEAAEWHPYRQQWIFFPRKVSFEPFDEAKDERERGGNLMLFANEDFTQIELKEVGERVPERGVSSFKVIPGRPNECIGLKSVEIDDKTETYAFAFNLEGEVLGEDVYLGPYKCEGIEIL